MNISDIKDKRLRKLALERQKEEKNPIFSKTTDYLRNAFSFFQVIEGYEFWHLVDSAIITKLSKTPSKHKAINKLAALPQERLDQIEKILDKMNLGFQLVKDIAMMSKPKPAKAPEGDSMEDIRNIVKKGFASGPSFFTDPFYCPKAMDKIYIELMRKAGQKETFFKEGAHYFSSISLDEFRKNNLDASNYLINKQPTQTNTDANSQPEGKV